MRGAPSATGSSAAAEEGLERACGDAFEDFGRAGFLEREQLLHRLMKGRAEAQLEWLLTKTRKGPAFSRLRRPRHEALEAALIVARALPVGRPAANPV